MMLLTRRLLSLAIALAFAGQLLLLSAQPALAQFFDESLQQEDVFTQEDQAFQEDNGYATDTGAPPTSQEQDFTEGNRFVDESLIPADSRSLTQGGRRLQLTLGKERNVLPLNIAWGAGTGLLIGGWLALIGEGDNRSTQRSIGLGIVTGILLGLAVGTRSVFNPNAPQPGSVGDAAPRPAKDGLHIDPVVALDKGNAHVGFRLTF